MSETRGHIELDRAIDSITVGARHRKDPGDLAKLAESIDRLGLLQPITITPDGVLVCGWRRLEAVRRLGWKSMKVWVRSGISDKLNALLAQQDENELHKPLNEIEKASLYRELLTVRKEEADRRVKEHQFGSTTGPGPGPGPVTGPGETGDARLLTALAITGKASYHTHERVAALMDWASRKATPPGVRAMAADALRRIENGEPVKPLYLEVKAAYDETQLPKPEVETDLARMAREALERVNGKKESGQHLTHTNGPAKHYRSTRSFNLIWTELSGLGEMYDVGVLALEMSDADWKRFDSVVTATIAFRDQLAAARRCARTPPDAPDA
ncbi:MAG TPA: ParB N-terminal domain-containing protein [Solirubrobacteraceae bacterium]|nr:ParB N-terminal domain-containing protein [Solirubrobacteraceae bacterium]